MARQVALVESGREVVQETRLWNADRGETASMRSKEEAHDYRYFPEPDLPPLVVAPEWIEEVRASLPELPAAEAAALRDASTRLPEYDAGVLTQDREVADYFEAAAQASGNAEGRLELGDDRGAAQAEGGRPAARRRAGHGPRRWPG